MLKLFFPPHFSFYQPYMALPALKSYMESRGVPAEIEDLNIISMNYLLSEGHLRKCSIRIEKEIKQLEKKSKLFQNERIYYEQLIKSSISSNFIIENIKKAVDFFHSLDQFTNFESYKFNEKIVLKAFEIISTCYFPTIISLSDFSMEYSAESSIDILKAINDKEKNPYINFYQYYFVNNKITDHIKLIGISVTALSQFIPALTLCKMIKLVKPELKIVLGGVIVNHLSEKIKKSNRLFDLFDFIIAGEGETPLYHLYNYINGIGIVEDVPNLIWKSNDKITENTIYSIENINNLPTPDFDGFPLDSYLSPMPVLSIEPARGCYYKKCTFCNQHSIHKDSFRLRKVNLIINDIKTLKKKYHSPLFNLSNEGSPEQHLKKIAQRILEEKIKINWYAGARLTKSLTLETCNLLNAAGCKKLLFGLESGNKRILALMKKGINLEDVPVVLLNCKKANIDIVLYLMIGYPTETIDEIISTRDFLIQNLKNVHTDGFVFYISVFQAMIDSPILSELESLDYEIEKNEYYDLTYIYKHYNNGKYKNYKREYFETTIEQMKNIIYSHLSNQVIPETITHYMYYKIEKNNIDYESLNKKNYLMTWSTIKSNDLISLNENVSYKKIKYLTHDNDYSILMYSFSLNKYFILNNDALEYLLFFRIPKTIINFKHHFSESEKLFKKDTRELFNFAFEENLLLIKKE